MGNKKKSNKPITSLEKVNNTLDKGKEIIKKGQEGLEQINNTSANLSSAFDKASGLVNNVNNLGNVYLESQRINSNTITKLEDIAGKHKNNSKQIDAAYNKQNRGMDAADRVIDAGLQSDDINIIREGLAAMTGIANTNPLPELKNSLDNEIEKDFYDDDFIIEI